MTTKRHYVTTAIPYVNADPHLGFALELVQADIVARHLRLRRGDVRFLSGTDENSLKNVAAASVAGLPVAEFVTEKAGSFAALRETLGLSYDDFIRTSVDLRHRAGAERLWRACAATGDLYERDYEGLYCIDCEAFLGAERLDEEGRCLEHRTSPERVTERNWFFRLSRYEAVLRSEIESRRLRIEPEERRNEALGFVREGLVDFSVSRSTERARGWGIPVPGDPTQILSVWFDALANYVTALGYGIEDDRNFRHWWLESDERIHVIGKGIVRFHAVHWPAILLSAGLPLPTAIFVHDYVTFGGQKLSKSSGTPISPEAAVERHGRDALRWWFARAARPAADVEFRDELIVGRARELAGGIGNLANRVIALAAAGGPLPVYETLPEGRALDTALERLPHDIDRALARFDLAAAAAAIWSAVVEANRFVSSTRPWELVPVAAVDEEAARRLDDILGLALDAVATIARELRPFLPEGAARIEQALVSRDRALGKALFPRTAAEVAGA